MNEIEPEEDPLSDENIARYKKKIDRDGWILISDLPDNFCQLNYHEKFGELMPQYSNKLWWDVKFDPRCQASHCSLSSLEVTPHTEFYESEFDPPNRLALWCLHPASCGGGKISFCDGYSFLKTLSPEERNYLDRVRYFYTSETGIASLGWGSNNYHTIVSKSSSGKDIFRFNLAGMHSGDMEFLQLFRQKFLIFYQSNSIDFLQPQNSFLIWDNFRMVHARSTPFQDLNRHLIRFWFK